MEESTLELKNYGYGYGSGNGNGSGYGFGYGCGYGYGSGNGDGYGDGSGYGYELKIPASNPWNCYHYIFHKDGKFTMRNHQQITIGQELHEENIRMCECGLHASITPKDAENYKPYSSVLTKVQIWGRVIVGKDKLVATDRKLIEICQE
jgi:hypothetical protein